MLNMLFLAPARPPRKPAPAAVQEKPADPPGEGAGVEAAPQVDAAVESVEELAESPEEKDSELTYLTLGSVDPDSAYRALFTFTNQGAGIRRVELSNPRFRD